MRKTVFLYGEEQIPFFHRDHSNKKQQKQKKTSSFSDASSPFSLHLSAFKLSESFIKLLVSLV